MLLEANPDDVAAVIVEPIAGNMGVVPPAEGFLAALRELTHSADALLIFDEVISGFRASFGGAQALYGVAPDLTCLGKVVGGGMPIGAYGGPAKIMEQVSPLGPAYQGWDALREPSRRRRGHRHADRARFGPRRTTESSGPQQRSSRDIAGSWRRRDVRLPSTAPAR